VHLEHRLLFSWDATALFAVRRLFNHVAVNDPVACNNIRVCSDIILFDLDTVAWNAI
jgi:hypothetical protein